MAEKSNAPRLSICIPTYNRADVLEETLKTLSFVKELPIEIVVSDNASPDHTGQVVQKYAGIYPNVKYYRQDTNVGAMYNHPAPFRLATGDYATFLADDDRIDIEPLWKIVKFLDDNPDIVVSFTGWYEWDDFNKKAVNQWNPIQELATFSEEDGLALFEYVVQLHIFPEVAVYRTRYVNKVQVQSHRTWAFHWWMWNFLRYGRICFHPAVYYKNLLVFANGEPNRTRTGDQMAQDCIGEYQNAIESVLFGAMLNNAELPVPTLMHTGALQLVNKFISQRLGVAGRMSVRDGDYISAYEFFSRYTLWNPMDAEKLKGIEEAIMGKAAIQAIIEIFEQTPETKSLVLCEFNNPDLVAQAFRTFRPDMSVRVETRENIIATRTGQELVLVERSESVEPFLQAGFAYGRVLSFLETCDCFRLVPR